MLFKYYREQKINLGVATTRHYRGLTHVGDTQAPEYSSFVKGKFLTDGDVHKLECQIDGILCC